MEYDRVFDRLFPQAGIQPSKLRCGDRFTVTIQNFATNPSLWNPDAFRVIGPKYERLTRVVCLFGRFYRVPSLKKTWSLEMEYISEGGARNENN